MTSTILNYIMSLFDNKATSAIASQLGENESNVSGAIQSMVPTVLAGFLNKANSETNGVQNLMDLALNSSNNNPWSNLAGGFSDNLGTTGDSLLSGLFGGNALGNIISSISGKSSMSSSSTSNLMKWIAPLVLSGLGKFISSKGLNLSSLTSLFNEERSSIMSALPAGLNLFGNAGDQVRSTTAAASNMVEEKKKSNILLPLILLLLLAGILWWAMKSCNKEPEVTPTAVEDTTATSNTTTTTTTTTRTLSEVKLNDATNLQAYPDGVENQLIQFITSEEYKTATEEQLKSKWFNFDDLNFEFGTTVITPASQRQLDNVVAILKAYPDVNIKLGAYTDKKGDDAANKKLSQERADAVKAALTTAGVGAQVKDAEGYGEEFATVDENASDEERETDRKTAIRLTK